MRCLPQPASVLAKISRTMLARSSMTSYWRVVSFHRSHAGSIRVNGLRSVLFAVTALLFKDGEHPSRLGHALLMSTDHRED